MPNYHDIIDTLSKRAVMDGDPVYLVVKDELSTGGPVVICGIFRTAIRGLRHLANLKREDGGMYKRVPQNTPGIAKGVCIHSTRGTYLQMIKLQLGDPHGE